MAETAATRRFLRGFRPEGEIKPIKTVPFIYMRTVLNNNQRRISNSERNSQVGKHQPYRTKKSRSHTHPTKTISRVFSSKMSGTHARIWRVGRMAIAAVLKTAVRKDFWVRVPGPPLYLPCPLAHTILRVCGAQESDRQRGDVAERLKATVC